MRLKTVQVTNFRSVEDSGEFEVSDVLCLVGKNEAGKSAILHALAGLNPHPATPMRYDLERDYPRRFYTEYATRHPDGNARVVSTKWELTEGDAAEIKEEFGDDALKSTEVTITRGYEDKEPRWHLPLNYPAVVKNLMTAARMNATEQKAFASATTSDELKALLEKLPEPTDKQKQLLARLQTFPGKNVQGRVNAILKESFPAFMYFAHYDRMVGQLRIDTFAARKAGQLAPRIEQGEQVFLDFIEYAGTSLDEIIKAQTYEGLNAKCEAASNSITQQLLDYWTQNPHLEIEVRVTKAEPKDAPPFNDGVIARARVKNTLHKASVPFSERSAGFIWFFSFLVKFAQVRKDAHELILLLDEPGLTLHGKAQADLLRYFDEKLAPEHQVIFSTHSPFMVPTDNLPSVRIVEDTIVQSKPGRWETHGTKVRDDVLAVDRDTLFPLQGALGYEITQSLFVGKHTLLLEGPGDILALQALSSALMRAGAKGLERRWTMCPAGGIDKIQTFVALFSGAKLDIAALTDFAKLDQKRLDNLRKSQILQGDRLLTYAAVLGLDEADLEDVLHPEVYLKAVNSAYGLSGKLELTVKKLGEVTVGTDRLLKKVEALCKLLPPEVPEFDHYAPMEWMFRNPDILDGDGDAAVETRKRAAKVIDSLNKLLP